jgi:excisionase family DNA binding protein
MPTPPDRPLATVERNSTTGSEQTSTPMDRLRMARIRPEQLLTVSAAAECVGCCEETIRRAYLARQLDVLRYGARRVRIRPSALFAWLERGGKTTAA